MYNPICTRFDACCTVGLCSRPHYLQFANVEEPVRRKVMTSSVAKPLASGVRTMSEMRGFELHPKEVAFGVLKEGSTYTSSVTIKNVGIDSCRFKIKQPPPSTGLKARYTPGPVSCFHVHLSLLLLRDWLWIHDHIPVYFQLTCMAMYKYQAVFWYMRTQ